MSQDSKQTVRLSELHLKMDSSSGRQWLHKQGIGRLKHLASRSLWLQQQVKAKEILVSQISTLLNLSDLGTKRLSRSRRAFLMYLLPMFCLHDSGEFSHVGEQEFADYVLQKQAKAAASRIQQQQQSNWNTPQHVRNIILLATMLSSGLSNKMNDSEDVVSLSAPAGFHDVHVQTHEIPMSVCIAFAVTVFAIGIPIFIFYRRQWSNLLGQQQIQINDLEQQLGDLAHQWYGEVEKSTHLQEELRVADDELAQLRRDVENHNRYCPLGRQITRSRFGARWHQDPNCQHLRQVDRDRIEHIYHCSSCSHARPLFGRNI